MEAYLLTGRCARAAVDQIFRHEIIHESENPEKMMDKIRGKPFGKIMPCAEDVERLQRFLGDARYLNKLRNNVAVHPLRARKMRRWQIKS